MSFRLWLMEDERARSWHPFALTRPAGELLFGTETLRARCERVLGRRCEGYAGCPSLSGFEEPGAPPCLADSGTAPGASASPDGVGQPFGGTGQPSGESTSGHARPPSPRTGTLVLSTRFVPTETAFSSLLADHGSRLRSGSAVLAASAEIAGLWLSEGVAPSRNLLAAPPAEWPRIPVEGTLLDSVWQLVAANGDRIAEDAGRFPDDELPPGVHRLGEHRISLGEGVRVEPGVILDASAGPVLLDAGVEVRAFSRIAGPAYVGPGSTVLGGSLESAGIGPRCKVRGEVQKSVLLGFANKAHEGFLGHSVVGRWANLGAATTNSDLKNTYGLVRFQAGEGLRDTGLTKAGCLLGDHVRTGIGTLLDTGAVVGAGSSLFGGGMPPKWVPPFSWGSSPARDGGEYDIDRFLATAAKVMARRGLALSDGMRNLYRRAFEATRPQRAG